METQNKLKLAGVLLGTTLISATAAIADDNMKSAEGSCGSKNAKSEKAMGMDADAKSATGKCGAEKAKKKVVTKDADAKCGTGKCG